VCLTKVTLVRKENFPRKQYGIGYKVIRLSTKKGKFQFLWFEGERPFNKWIICYKRPNTKIMALNGWNYPAGFHIFEKRSDAEQYKTPHFDEIVVQVRYRRIVARGFQDGAKCVIAKKIYVVYDKNNKGVELRKTTIINLNKPFLYV